LTARLFTAIVPPARIVAALTKRLADVPTAPGLRWVPPEKWHVTLGFFGADDASTRQAWLEPRLPGVAAPRVRFAGSGTFRGVLWCGVAGDDITDLAHAAGAHNQQRAFHPHVTLARGRPPGGLDRIAAYLREYRGPSWLATEVVLLRSDRGEHGAVYTPVARYPLDTSSASGELPSEDG